MGRRRCACAGCARLARAGAAFCAAHVAALDEAAARAPEPDWRQEGNGAEPTAAGVAWVQGQWTAREMRALERLAGDLLGAEAGLTEEIAAARLALLRVLREETDAVRLVDGVSKAAGVILRARQVEAARAAAGGGPLRALADAILDELAREGMPVEGPA